MVAEIVAVICGKPAWAAWKLIALSVISRPLTDTLLLLATTNCCKRRKKFERWKKLPWNVNVKGSIGNPASPTAAPGGSAAVAAWLAEDDVVGAAEDAVAGLSVRPRKSTV